MKMKNYNRLTAIMMVLVLAFSSIIPVTASASEAVPEQAPVETAVTDVPEAENSESRSTEAENPEIVTATEDNNENLLAGGTERDDETFPTEDKDDNSVVNEISDEDGSDDIEDPYNTEEAEDNSDELYGSTERGKVRIRLFENNKTVVRDCYICHNSEKLEPLYSTDEGVMVFDPSELSQFASGGSFEFYVKKGSNYESVRLFNVFQWVFHDSGSYYLYDPIDYIKGDLDNDADLFSTMSRKPNGYDSSSLYIISMGNMRHIKSNNNGNLSEQLIQNFSKIKFIPSFKDRYTGSAVENAEYNAGSGSEGHDIFRHNVDNIDFVAFISPSFSSKFKITYDANGGTGAVPVDSNEYDNGSSAQIKGKGSLKRNGYEFVGWCEDQYGSLPIYKEGVKITVSRNIKFYAIWKNTVQPKPCLVRYEGNGAQGDAPEDTKVYMAGDSVKIQDKGNLDFFGLEFEGWTENLDGTGKLYKPGDIITITEPMTFYAKWKKPENNKLPLDQFIDVDETDAPPFYEFSLRDNKPLNVSVDLEADTSASYSVTLYKRGRQGELTEVEGMKDDSSLSIQYPFIGKFSKGTNVIFRRVLLPPGDYLIAFKKQSDSKYGLKEKHSLYINTYDQTGVDLTRDALPIKNEEVNFYDGFGRFLPKKCYENVFGKARTRFWSLEKNMYNPGQCLGLSSIAYFHQSNNPLVMSKIPEKYRTPDLNKGGFDTVDPELGPRLKWDSELSELIGSYIVWQWSGGRYWWFRNCTIAESETGKALSQKGVEDLLNALENGEQIIMLLKWNGGAHYLLFDSCRNTIRKADSQDSTKSTKYRIYLYDSINPYYEPFSKVMKKGDFADAETRFIDLYSDGRWEISGLSETYKVADGIFLNASGLPDHFSQDESFKPAYDNGDPVSNWFVNVFTGLKNLTNDNDVYYDANTPDSNKGVEEHVIAGDGSDDIYRQLIVPYGRYKAEIESGSVSFIHGNGFVTFSSTGHVSAEVIDQSKVVLRSNDNSTATVIVAEGTEDSYSKATTSVLCSDKSVTVEVKDGKATITSAAPQTIDLELETESGDGLIENISTSEINGLDIAENVDEKFDVDFDEQGGSYVEDIRGVVPGTTVVLPETEKAGSDFAGWFTEPNGRGTRYTDETPITKSVQLFACWDSTGFTVSGLSDGYEYTGAPVKPQIRVYDGGKLLTENRDYTLKYSNNTKAYEIAEGQSGFSAKAAPTITVTGTGNYGGKETVFFRITKPDIGGGQFSADDMVIAATGKAQSVVPVLNRNGKALKNKTDYTVAGIYKAGNLSSSIGTSVKDAGDYVMKLSGAGNFTGERTVNLKVTADLTPISKLKAPKLAAMSYTGDPLCPEPVIKNGVKTLEKNKHYTVEYGSNIAVGTGYVILTGIPSGGYSGTLKIPFAITGTPISKAVIDGIPKTADYTGNPITLSTSALKVYIKADRTNPQKNLVLGRDYTVSYKDNTAAGSATVIFTGKGGYTGSTKKTFKINPFDCSPSAADAGRLSVTVSTPAPYSKDGAKPAVTVKFRCGNGVTRKLTENADYKLSYSNNTKVADKKKPTVTVTGKGSFKGSRSAEFTIVPKNLGKVTVTAADKVFSPKEGNYVTTVTLTDDNGKKLKAGTDYEKDFEYFYADDNSPVDTKATADAGKKIRVVVKAKDGGNYSGTAEAVFRITAADIKSVTVGPIDAQTYTGNAVKIDASKLTVKNGKAPLTPYDASTGKGDFRIREYSNNVNKGTATLVLEGVGNYGGTKSVTFKINARNLLWKWRQ